MRRLFIGVGIVASLASLAPTAAAAVGTTPRVDPYHEIWCTTATGDVYLAKRVDARAIQPERDPGGKDTATERFNENNPYGEHCVEGALVTP
jgi:hypothetical protein